MKKILCFVLALALVFAFGGCSAEPYMPISWDYLSGLPEGFPKLCDAVTANVESFSATADSFAIYWNVLEEDEFDGYLAKIEEWAEADFGKAKDGVKTLNVLVGDDEVTVTATYSGDADGKKNEEEQSGYNCQACIDISKRALRATAYFPIKWEYVYGLPKSFPKLCDSVTTVDEYNSEDKCSVALYWNILSKESYDRYVAEAEAWAGEKFGAPAADGTVSLTATVDGEKITVKAAYNGSSTGIYLTGNKYDSQARIEIIREG